MDQKTESTTRRMDCSELLEHVLRTESFLPESADAYFGHPPPPKLSILDLDGISLMVSQTKRCVSAQIWKDSSIGEPDEVICMPPKGEVAPDDEIITALTLMTKNDRVAIVVGTSYSRILSVEVKINSSAPLLERFGPPFEPLPIETTNDSHDESSHSDSLSKSKHGSRADASGTDKKTVTFRPSGGVNHIEEYVIDSKNVVWISYKDGTLIRLPPESFFPSITNNNVVWKEHSDKLLRAQVMLPPGSLGTALFVMALPKHHPSPLAPLAPGKPEDFDIIEPVSLNPEDGDDSVPEFHEALSYGGGAATGLGDLSPSLSFYTSEDQFLGRITGDAEEGKKLPSHDESVLFDNAIDATTAIVGGVFGAAMGVVKWGFRGGRGRKDIQPSRDIEVDFMLDSTEDQDPEARELFSTLHNEPYRLYPGYELHDAPRLVMSASIDPQGNLAATTDTLGRVLLIDLDTKQVVRMWKGVREASCCWMEGRGKKSKRKLYVVIHSRQRRTVEVWEARHGRKVLAMQVGRDAQLVPCKTRNFAGCMLLQSSRPGSAMNHLVLLAPNNNAANSETDMTLNASSPKTGSSTSIQAAAMRLQTLQQLLDNTNVPCQKQDVFEALTQVTALKDLCTALDLLSVSSSLEERMGVKGAEFQKLALTHCRALFDNSSGNSGADPNNPLMQTLSARITFHSQLVAAYEVLNAFEACLDQVVGEKEKVTPRSAWSVEALSWITTAETVSGANLDEYVIKKREAVAKFAAFASSCSSFDQIKVADPLSKNFKVCLSDSSRTRKEILVRIFTPLLQDVFSFSVTNTILEHLGLTDDIDYLQTCFGEWFMSIPAKEAANKAFLGSCSPMTRWLQEIVSRQIEIQVANVDASPFVALGSLQKFCTSSDDLVRAFVLSSLCREAVSVVTKKKEVKTFGKIWRQESVQPWESLLRKLRVCLLVSLRLHGMNLGTFPITVENVESNDMFSIYEWVARDELISSHKHDAIVSLEKTCKGSGLVFDPSTSIGDNPSRWKVLQLACLANAISEEERAEYLVDSDDDVQGALLLYLSSHNNPSLLVAHRALLLAGYWKNDPSNLELLRDSVEALSHLDEDGPYKALAGAVRREVWQTCFRPVFRALFFGFHDEHQVLEDVISSLIGDFEWLRSFGKTSLQLLSLLYRSCWGDAPTHFKHEINENIESSNTWPPVKEDFILKRLVETSRCPNSTALDLHRAIICGCMVSEDYENLAGCINGFYDAFLPNAISEPSSSHGGDPEKQMEFLEQASIGQASRLTKDAIIDRYDLGEIETLAELWGIEVRDVRTIFLLAMYELGKDAVVDSLVTKSAQKMDLNRFVEDGLGIVCRRLNYILNVKRSPHVRKVMGLLDADTCEWVREHAELSIPLIDERTDATIESIPLSSTHLFVLRLLSFSSAMGAKAMSVKIHSLSILSGTVMKALEGRV